MGPREPGGAPGGADADAALRLAAELDPDVVVIEACQPGLDGARVTAKLRELLPGMRVLALAGCEDRATLQRLRDAGAAGYVLKRAAPVELVGAIRAVAAGGRCVDPAFRGAAHDPAAPVELSEREREMVRLIALGHSNKEIAARLTAETYKGRSMEKLGLNGRVDIVHFAARQGWLADLSESPPAPVHANGRVAQGS